MNVLDLFSGIGGFSLGLERAGMRTVAFCEIEPFCRDVLAKHWPDIPCNTDITGREFREGEADIICGGFPCQDISNAGQRTGIAGERSGLWRELLRAIRVVRPVYAIMENVAALLSRGMGDVLGDLAEIGQDAEWNCIPASAVGAPHRRDRVWIVAADPARGRHGLDGLGEALERQLAHSIPHVANATGGGWDVQHSEISAAADTREAGGCSGELPLAYPNSARLSNGRQARQPQGADEAGGGMALAELERCCGAWWAIEPDVDRVAHGVPARVDRLRSLGNAVVPQIPEIIGRAIMSANKQAHTRG